MPTGCKTSTQTPWWVRVAGLFRSGASLTCWCGPCILSVMRLPQAPPPPTHPPIIEGAWGVQGSVPPRTNMGVSQAGTSHGQRFIRIPWKQGPCVMEGSLHEGWGRAGTPERPLKIGTHNRDITGPPRPHHPHPTPPAPPPPSPPPRLQR